jgi:hypothetical protein
MEPSRFDRLARGVTHARSRRGMLGVLASGALGIGVGAARPQPVAASCRKASNCTKARFRVCQNNGECIRVKNVDTGRCACVFIDECPAASCTKGSECASGLCVFAKGCCDNRKHCADPCVTV